MNKDFYELKPINLKDLFSNSYKITLDESASCQGENKKDLWYFQIPCKYGHIYPISDKYLGFWCDSRVIKARMVRDAPEIELVQDGDGEGVFRFTPGQFGIVARYARPRRRRRLKTNHKQKLQKSNQRHRFISQNHGSKVTKSGLKSTISKQIGVWDG